MSIFTFTKVMKPSNLFDTVYIIICAKKAKIYLILIVHSQRKIRAFLQNVRVRTWNQ